MFLELKEEKPNPIDCGLNRVTSEDPYESIDLIKDIFGSDRVLQKLYRVRQKTYRI